VIPVPYAFVSKRSTKKDQRVADILRTTPKRLVPSQAEAEPVNDVEREFLEPVARYLAILQEWSLERLADGTGTVPPSEQR
jgi:hypothetical protein